MKKLATFCIFLLLLVGTVAQAQDKVTLTWGSWRTDDVGGYAKMIALFEASHPNIEVKFEPTLASEYSAQLQASLDGGAGPDLITCKPFDLSLLLYNAGYLTDVTDLPGMEHFSDVAKGAWSTDDGTVTYCVPMGSVLHGFLYNKDIFSQVGVEVPRTESEFFAVLDKIKAAGITPLAISTKDNWPAAIMGFENLWPNFAGGEPERQAIIAGTGKYTDQGFIDVLTSLSKWADYMPEGHQSLGYADAQQLFTLGQAAIFPSGSWEIPGFEAQADFELGAFKPYQPDGAAPADCWISDEVDIATTANKHSAHPEEARIFLEWLTTQEFAQSFADTQAGFFPLADYPVEIKDPLAAEFVSWRQDCKSTIRLLDQTISRGDPSAVNLELDNVYLTMQGKLTPEEVATTIQTGLDKWYKPASS